MGRLCYPTQAPSRVPVLQPENCHGARRVWRTFCSYGTNFFKCWRDRGTSLIGVGKLSRYRIFVMGTGAVSRYNLSRSQKFITVQDLNCGQMWESGCIYHYEFVMGAGAKAKSVTNNLPILTVLAVGLILKLSRYSSILKVPIKGTDLS